MTSDYAPPTVSVLMPVFNAAPYLGEAIESIRAQSFRDWELIAVDDGSTDASLELLRQFEAAEPRLRILTQAQGGVARARNVAIGAARGEFLASQDADDISLPDRLQLQVSYLMAHPECSAVGGQALLVDIDGDPIGPSKSHTDHEGIETELLAGRGLALPQGGSMLRRQTVAAVGGYCETLRVGEDLDLFLRIAEHARLANLPQIVAKFRKHLGNTTAAMTQADTDALRHSIVRQAYVRRGWPESEIRVRTPRQLGPIELRLSWIRSAIRHGYCATARKHTLRLLRQGSISPRVLASLARSYMQLPTRFFQLSSK